MIETERLQLFPCELQHFEAILHDQQKLGSLLNVNLRMIGLDLMPRKKPCSPAINT